MVGRSLARRGVVIARVREESGVRRSRGEAEMSVELLTRAHRVSSGSMEQAPTQLLKPSPEMTIVF